MITWWLFSPVDCLRLQWLYWLRQPAGSHLAGVSEHIWLPFACTRAFRSEWYLHVLYSALCAKTVTLWSFCFLKVTHLVLFPKVHTHPSCNDKLQMFSSDELSTRGITDIKMANSSNRWKMEMKTKCFQGAFSNFLVILSVDLDCIEIIACADTPFATWGKVEMTCLQGKSGRKAWILEVNMWFLFPES